MRTKAAALGAGLALASLVVGSPAEARMSSGGASPQSAGETTSDGYRAVAVSYDRSTDVDPGLAAQFPAAPALCWWDHYAPGFADATDPEDVKDYWFNRNGRPTGHAYAGLLEVDSEMEFDKAIEAENSMPEPGVTWYSLQTNGAPVGDPQAYSDKLSKSNCSYLNDRQYMGISIIVGIRWFPDGETPEPQVDPEVLAEYAYRVMRLVEPTLEWNPQIRNRDGATMINIPTWVWVNDVDAVGTRRVRATAGDVTVEVVARTDGIRVSWPDGSKRCSSAQAKRAYAPGVDESQACVIEFSKASFGSEGFPVRAESAWSAEWTSNTGDSGELRDIPLSATTNIRVAGSQAIVTDVD